jgi:hypothetical protein
MGFDLVAGIYSVVLVVLTSPELVNPIHVF